jgi:hypothetical protein
MQPQNRKDYSCWTCQYFQPDEPTKYRSGFCRVNAPQLCFELCAKMTWQSEESNDERRADTRRCLYCGKVKGKMPRAAWPWVWDGSQYWCGQHERDKHVLPLPTIHGSILPLDDGPGNPGNPDNPPIVPDH